MENLSSQKQKVTHDCHGKIQFKTTKSNYSRQTTNTHGKNKTIIAIQNWARQEQNTYGKSRTLTEKANAHGKNQIKDGGQWLSKHVA